MARILEHRYVQPRPRARPSLTPCPAGASWPQSGEIDMVEGVNNYTNNQVTLHTEPGCTLSSSDPSTLGISGTLVDGTDCAVADTANAGCGIRGDATNSFGAPFNSNGGGVFASASRFLCFARMSMFVGPRR